MARLVLGGHFQLFLGSERVSLFASHGLFVYCELNVTLVCLLLVFKDRVYQCLVDDVGYVSPTHAGSLPCQQVQLVLGLRLEGPLAHVVFKQLLPAVLVGQVDFECPVEPARTQQRGVERIYQIGGTDHDDVFIFAEPIHLRQHLV